MATKKRFRIKWREVVAFLFVCASAVWLGYMIAERIAA